MPLHAETTMPPGLGDFPWADQLHMWDVPWGYGGGIKLRIWYEWDYEHDETPQEYHVRSMLTHHQVWDWLAERFEIAEIPILEMQGTAWVQPRDRIMSSGMTYHEGQQYYEGLACWGTFCVSPR